MISDRFLFNAKEFAIVYTQLLKNLGNFAGDTICFSNDNYRHSVIFLSVNFGYEHDFIWDYDIAKFIEYCEHEFQTDDQDFDNCFNQAKIQCIKSGLITD